ncbi:hypothetical protein [Clostridium cuniculi]|jgi:tryptophanyl-tRNA synthetase|uniref:hypothetical protein n=1 Tax=Clostridium cuniculi TaxID=2548455 RepID=UPI0018A9D2ED|nr:hypothetical protein [Clostridium cuniculi]
MEKQILLTGDRPTGKLHIGHYIGSLVNRVNLQNTGLYNSYIMIADQQALTDNARNPEKIRNSLIEVALDYLSVGIDPTKSTIFIQSQIPELSELTMHYLNLVTVSRLERNPTVKSELKEMKEHYQRGGLGDVKVKKYLNEIIQAELKPIRNNRKMYESDIDYVYDILKEGSINAREVASTTLLEVRKAIGLDYFKK